MKRREFCQTAGLVAGALMLPSMLNRSAFAGTSRFDQTVGFRLQLSSSKSFRATDLIKEVDGYASESITAADLGSSHRIYWRVTDTNRRPVDLRIAHNYGYFDDRAMLPHLVTMYNGLTLPWVIATYGDSSVGADETNTGTPDVYDLGQNFPNPFRDRTTIPFSLGASGLTTVKVYNVLGQEVATLLREDLLAGRHEVTWVSENTASGTYMLVLTAGEFRQTLQMAVIN